MKPTFKITVSGTDITPDVSKRLVTLEWLDTITENSDTFTLALDDSGQELAIPTAGALVTIAAGYDYALQEAGRFSLDETELGGGSEENDTLTVSGSSTPFLDKSGKSASDRKTKTWASTTLGNVAKTIAGNLGVTPSVSAKLASVALANEQQSDESDTNFILKLVRREGGYLKFTQGRMVIADEGAGTSTGGQSLNVSLGRRDITKWRVRAGGKSQGITRVKMKYHDFKSGETKTVTADVPKSGSIGQFGVSQADTGTYTPTDFSGQNPWANSAQANSAAKTTAARIARNVRKIELVLPGRLDIVAGGKITLTSEHRVGVAGIWLVKTVRHRISKQGWTMTVEGEGS